jgi:hypothetical protein
MSIHIGFTGTRKGMTSEQNEKIRFTLQSFRDYHFGMDLVFHHGDEPHSDREAAEIAQKIGYRIKPHPPAAMTSEDLLKRNREIVAAVENLFAAPGGFKEELRSGTWATVRYGRQAGLEGLIIWPDGCRCPLSAKEHVHGVRF